MSDRTRYLPAPSDWEEWRPVFLDEALWRPVVQVLVRQTGTAVGQQIEAGFPGTCAVFIVDQAVVVKIFPPFLPQDYRVEVETYQLLGARLDPYLPRLLAHGTYADQIDWFYMVLAFKPGQPLRDLRQEIPPANLAVISQEVGWLLSDIHATPFESAQALKPQASIWREFVRQQQTAALHELRERAKLPETVVNEAAALLADFMPDMLAVEVDAAGGRDRRLHLLNGDLTEDHLLLKRQLGVWQISALIDWADALIGQIDYEWVALWFGLCAQDPVMFRQILHAYDPEITCDYEFRRRMLAYTLIHRFGPFIIAELGQKPGAPSIEKLADLLLWLWPPMLA